jgi:hypothetical protein
LFRTEHGNLAGVHPNGHDDFIEEGKCATNNVHMTQRDGIKSAGKNTDSFHV